MFSKKIITTKKFISIFNIKFIRFSYPELMQHLSEGGFMVVPSAPSLMLIKSGGYYYQCLRKSDFALPDSSLMVLALKLIYKVELKKLSGLAFLKLFFSDCAKDFNSKLFLVEPTQEDHDANKNYLNTIGVTYDSSFYYVAPVYKDNVIEDHGLLKQLEEQKPKYIIINLGGGIQEKLGYFLKINLSYKPAIICTGAAIAFLSGRQAKIPMWGDEYYLGWLFRCISNPRRFVPRYFASLRLIQMLIGCEVKHE